MIRNCPKSCNLCHKKYRREKKPIEIVESTEELIIDEEGQPIIIPDHCADKYYVTDCQRRAELGQCDSNFV